MPSVIPSSPGTNNLIPLGDAGKAAHLKLVAVEGAHPKAQGNVVVNSLGQVDHLQIAATGLEPGLEYQLSIVTSRTAPFGDRTPLTKGKATPAGAFLAQALGPIRQVAGPDSGLKSVASEQRFLLVSTVDSNQPVLLQEKP